MLSFRLAGVVVCLLIIFAGLLWSHSPGLLDPDHPFHVDDAAISRALYGEFQTGEEVFIVELTFKEDFALPFELFVPHRNELKGHRPAYAIVGNNLPVPSIAQLAALPKLLPIGAGAYVDLNEINPRPVFYESFTRRFFYSSGVTAYVLPKGSYEFWLWSPQKTSGKFGIGFGVEERVEWRDALNNWGFYAY